MAHFDADGFKKDWNHPDYAFRTDGMSEEDVRKERLLRFGGAWVDSTTQIKSIKAEVTDDMVAKAKRIIGSSPVKAAGYRIKIFLLEAEEGLDAGQAAVAPTLASLGFKAKTDHQKEREDRGSDMAIVVSVGDGAYTAPHLAGVKWCKEGDIIRILRYAGHQFEDPPGSGRRYALINDEDVLGVYEDNVTEAGNG